MVAPPPVTAPTTRMTWRWPFRRSAGGRQRRLPLFSAGIIALLVFVSIFAELVSPADPFHQTLRARLLPPVWEAKGSWAHILGSDQLGRDVLARIIYGARVSLAAGCLTVLLATAIGVTAGLVAGYYRGWVDAVLMQFADAMLKERDE